MEPAVDATVVLLADVAVDSEMIELSTDMELAVGPADTLLVLSVALMYGGIVTLASLEVEPAVGATLLLFADVAVNIDMTELNIDPGSIGLAVGPADRLVVLSVALEYGGRVTLASTLLEPAVGPTGMLVLLVAFSCD